MALMRLLSSREVNAISGGTHQKPLSYGPPPSSQCQCQCDTGNTLQSMKQANGEKDYSFFYQTYQTLHRVAYITMKTALTITLFFIMGRFAIICDRNSPD
jgi:hypothetical protein